MDARLAYTFLRACGAPKMAYLCTVVNPTIMCTVYDQMDGMIAQGFSAITGVPADNPLIFAPSGGDLPSFRCFGPEL